MKNAVEVLKKLKVLGIITAILMIILGLVAFFSPLMGQTIAIWLMVAGLFIYGVEEIIDFCASPKGKRNGFGLATGIIWVILCIVLVVNALNADALTNLVALGAFDYFIAIIVGFVCIFNAISDFAICSKAEELGYTKSGLIVSGILGILAGLVILTYPIGAMITLTVFYGIFLVAGGITLLCRCMSQKTQG